MSNAMNTPPDPSGRSQQLHTRRQKGASSAWSCAVEPKSALSLRVKVDTTGCAGGGSKTRDGRRRIDGRDGRALLPFSRQVSVVRPRLCLLIGDK